MPKTQRGIGQRIHRYTPITSSAIAPITFQFHQLPKLESTMQASQQYPMGGPVQPLNYTAPPVHQRPGSSAWTPQNDEILLNARAKGMNWQPIQAQHFPEKTPNACRKRHERLMQARSHNEDWEGDKMKELADRYMCLRDKIWKSLADEMGEKWGTVEAKCMGSGIKNLQRLARSYSREQRLQDNDLLCDRGSHVSQSHPRHHSGQLPAPVLPYNNRNSVGRYIDDRNDDSGVSVYDEGDNGYSPNDQNFRSSGEFGMAPESMVRPSEEHWNHARSMQGRDTMSVMQQQPPQLGYGRIDQRYTMSSVVPSTDMRIPALINGPNNVTHNGLNGHGHESAMNRRGHDSGNGMNGMNSHMSGQHHGNGGRN